MTSLVVHPAGRPLIGSVPVPSDSAIARSTLLVAALVEGPVRITAFSPREDDGVVLAALRTLGLAIDDATPNEVRLVGRGIGGLREPSDAIDCGGSAPTMRLLAGALAAQRFPVTLVGDARLSHQGMLDVAAPLRARGARVEGRADPESQGQILPPLHTGRLPPERALGPLEFASTRLSPDVKGAVFLSGLYADGVTRFAEPTVSRDHVERLLAALGAPLRSFGPVLELDPAGWDRRLPGFEVALPGDASAAAVVVAAAHMVPGSRVTLRAVGTNPTRSGWLQMARDMGAGLSLEPKGERLGEPVSDVHAWCAPLHGISMGGETLARAAEQFPLLCALAARASGPTRVLQSDGLFEGHDPAIAAFLQAFGVTSDRIRDGLEIEGSAAPLVAADIDSRGDAAIAMASVVLGLAAGGPTRIRDAGCVASRFPRLVATLRALGARIDVEP
jgi:3-phosphoshikimate 1-carboxyvinyltransferase